MSCAWRTARLIALGFSFALAVYVIWPRDVSLTARGRKIIRRRVVYNDFAMLPRDVLAYLDAKENGGYDVVIVSARAGTQTVRAKIRTGAGSDLRRLSWRVAPTGRHMLWAQGGPGRVWCTVADISGRHLYSSPLPSQLDGFAPLVAWQPSGTAWVYVSVTTSALTAVTVDRQSGREICRRRSLVERFEGALLGMLPHDRALLLARGPGGGWKGDLLDLPLTGSGAAASRHPVPRPPGSALYGAALSPDGAQVAWLYASSLPAPVRGWWESIPLWPKAPRKPMTFTVYVSRPDCTGLRKIGSQPGDPREQVWGLRWSSSGTEVAFAYRGEVWLVTAH